MSARLSPGSKLIVLADDFASDGIVKARDLIVDGYVLWRDLCSDALPHLLRLIALANVTVGGHEVSEAFIAARRPAPVWPPASVWLTEQEQLVVRGLTAGMTRPEIATAVGVSVRTLHRTIADLEHKLDAPTALVLAYKAGQLGLLD